MANMNKVVLVGRLGKDPDLRTSRNGKPYCTFSLATANWRTKETDWHNVVCFGKTAEFIGARSAKGDVLAVSGRIANNNYTDKNGVKRYSYNIEADDVQIAAYSDAGTGTGSHKPEPTSISSTQELDSEQHDIPF